MRYITRSIILTMAGMFLLSHSVMAAEPQVLTFGVVPQQAANKLAKKWGPLFKHLGEKSGYTIRFKTAPNIPEFERRLSRGEYDLAYMNPYHYTVFGDQPGYRAFAKRQTNQGDHGGS